MATLSTTSGTDFISIQFCHVKRNCNVVADALAKKVKDTLSLAVWLEDVPEDIAHLLVFDGPLLVWILKKKKKKIIIIIIKL